MSGKGKKGVDGYRDDSDNYDTFLPAPGEDDDGDNGHNSSSSSSSSKSSTRRAINPSRELLDSTLEGNGASDKDLTDRYKDQFGSGLVNTRISDRENEVRRSSIRCPIIV
jgi:hypothetical protein